MIREWTNAIESYAWSMFSYQTHRERKKRTKKSL